MKKLSRSDNKYTLFAPFVNNKNRNRYSFYEPEWLSASHFEGVENIPAKFRMEAGTREALKQYFFEAWRTIGCKYLPVILLLLGFYTVQAQMDYSVKSLTGLVSGTSALHS